MNIYKTILFSILVSSSALANQKSKLYVAATSIPPYYISSAGKNIDSGSLYLYMDKLVKSDDFNSEWRTLPAKRLYDYLINGKVNLFGGIVQIPKHVKDKVIFSKCTIGNTAVSLVSKKYIPFKLKELKGTVGAVRGLSYLGMRKKISENKNIKMIDILDYKKSLEMLSRNRIDYVLVYSKNRDSIIPQHFKQKVINESEMRVLISKKTPGFEKLRMKIDKAIEKLNPEFCNSIEIKK